MDAHDNAVCVLRTVCVSGASQGLGRLVAAVFVVWLSPGFRSFPADYRQELPSYGVYVHGQQRGRIISGAFGELIHTMLTYGSGLHIGPDCDGQLNLCDDTLHTPPPNSGPSASQVRHTEPNRHSSVVCYLSIHQCHKAIL